MGKSSAPSDYAALGAMTSGLPVSSSVFSPDRTGFQPVPTLL
jgi:hypothetical protein